MQILDGFHWNQRIWMDFGWILLKSVEFPKIGQKFIQIPQNFSDIYSDENRSTWMGRGLENRFEVSWGSGLSPSKIFRKWRPMRSMPAILPAIPALIVRLFISFPFVHMDNWDIFKILLGNTFISQQLKKLSQFLCHYTVTSDGMQCNRIQLLLGSYYIYKCIILSQTRNNENVLFQNFIYLEFIY